MDTISLRPLEEKDSERMLEWMRDPDITQFLRIGGKDTTEDQVLNFIKNAHDESINLHRAIVDANDLYLGTVSLKNIDHGKKEAEYAISMHHSALGTGAAKEGSQLILEVAFSQLGLERIYLNVFQENRRAIRFYEKFGFQYNRSTIIESPDRTATLLWYELKSNSSSTLLRII